MIVCPLCEHAQVQGGECENCGKQLSPDQSVAPPIEQIPDLELSRAEEVGEIRIAPVEDLISAPASARPAEKLTILLDEVVEEDAWGTCHNCGIRAKVIGRCGACGLPQSVAEP